MLKQCLQTQGNMPNNDLPTSGFDLPVEGQSAFLNAGSSPSSPSPEAPAAMKETAPAPKELPAYEFLGYLPDSYGTKKLFLVARDPHILFAYWDLSQVQYQEAARAAHDGKVFL